MASEEGAGLLPPSTDGGSHILDDAGGQLMEKFAALRIFSFGSFWSVNLSRNLVMSSL